MTTIISPLDLDAGLRYRVDGYSGVAFRIAGLPQRWEPDLFFCYDEDANIDDETGEPGYWVEGDDGEWVDDHSGQVLVVMVGDDRRHTVDVEDLTPLDDDEFCSECGSIGCGWGH